MAETLGSQQAGGCRSPTRKLGVSLGTSRSLLWPHGVWMTSGVLPPPSPQ